MAPAAAQNVGTAAGSPTRSTCHPSQTRRCPSAQRLAMRSFHSCGFAPTLPRHPSPRTLITHSRTSNYSPHSKTPRCPLNKIWPYFFPYFAKCLSFIPSSASFLVLDVGGLPSGRPPLKRRDSLEWHRRQWRRGCRKSSVRSSFQHECRASGERHGIRRDAVKNRDWSVSHQSVSRASCSDSESTEYTLIPCHSDQR